MAELVAAVCWPCVVGLHEECLRPEVSETEDLAESWVTCCCRNAPAGSDANVWALGGEVGRPPKDASEIDSPEAVKNTGRKRAQQLYPIIGEVVCEWAGLLYAGGGIEPIIGCDFNVMVGSGKNPLGGDVHHSPDKNTLNNTPGSFGGNAHRICKSCHHTWHARNDRYYSKDRPGADEAYLPIDNELSKNHDPFTEASVEQIEAANVGRKGGNARATEEQIEALRESRRALRAQFLGSVQTTTIDNPFATPTSVLDES